MRETADVVIVGSGCGGGASAKVLAQAGKRVTVLEEGGTYAPSDFDGSEQSAYQNLYRRRAGRAPMIWPSRCSRAAVSEGAARSTG